MYSGLNILIFSWHICHLIIYLSSTIFKLESFAFQFLKYISSYSKFSIFSIIYLINNTCFNNKVIITSLTHLTIWHRWSDKSTIIENYFATYFNSPTARFSLHILREILLLSELLFKVLTVLKSSMSLLYNNWSNFLWEQIS